uniref:Uncharacterized protein n=1 Tax=Tetranychus urticae TaxID=32264 RepID=T1L4G2_TETUR
MKIDLIFFSLLPIFILKHNGSLMKIQKTKPENQCQPFNSVLIKPCTSIFRFTLVDPKRYLPFPNPFISSY